VSSDLCRYNAVTGEWLKDEVLIKMASQVSRGLSCEGAGPRRDFPRLFYAILSLLLDLILLFTFLYFSFFFFFFSFGFFQDMVSL
jgi:hypothetical protein